MKTAPEKPDIGAEFKPLIRQILAEGFDCAMRGLNRSPFKRGMGAELDSAALQILAEGVRLHNGSLNRPLETEIAEAEFGSLNSMNRISTVSPFIMPLVPHDA